MTESLRQCVTLECPWVVDNKKLFLSLLGEGQHKNEKWSTKTGDPKNMDQDGVKMTLENEIKYKIRVKGMRQQLRRTVISFLHSGFHFF